MFSTRLPGSLEPTLLAAAVRSRRAAGRAFVDLTESNPTRAGFRYDERLLAPLADPSGLTYAPEPLGLVTAREAVAADYARRGVAIAPDRIAITASTSESYSFLFKLLCAPGDVVLVPQPSYPLFTYLTRLDGITGRPYTLDPADGWVIDAAALEDLVDDRTRAVLVVAPNNPTGTRLRSDVLRDLAAFCARRRLALVGDEVFADYELTDVPGAARSVLEQDEVLTFSLGGLSKTVGLPQVKLGWIGVGGPARDVQQALAHLEVIADASLSVSTPVQVAAGRLLESGAAVREQIVRRIRANHETLRRAGNRFPACRIPAVEGGWSAVIQAPAVEPDEARALALLEQQDVLVHPGSLFDFDREGYFVVSLLPEEAQFAPAVERVLAALHVE
ncbi:MAG TPA: pyridoxal phosphate-dependent aminotransferase [Vicinamibacterales bacterium]|nr:pyridoxal phosphate-dependent aminotransferase [Vicinamibacterales bacterium]